MANEFKIKKGLIVEGASGGVVVNVLGSQGQLLSVTDNLSGSIFAVSDISGVPIFDVNSSGVSYFDGTVGIGTTAPTSLLEISKQLSAASTIDYPYTISSRDDGNSINQGGGEGVGIKFRIAGNAATTPGDSLVGASIAAIRESSSDADSSTGLGFFVTQNDETLDEALRLTHDLAAEFASSVQATQIIISSAVPSILFDETDVTARWRNRVQTGGYRLQYASNGSTFTDHVSLGANAFTLAKDTTFTEQAFSAATSSGDASSTLTTKGYVDSLITGATIYRGTWQAGISATSTGTTTASTTLTVSAAILDAAGNTPTLVGAVVTGAGITGTVKVASVTSSTVYELDTAISATATAYIFSPIYGAPDLSGVTQTSGYYYICSEAGSATPNGAGTEPNTWDVGDWVIWNDDVGASGEWQKVDNSSVLSGVGTGQTVALWEGPSSVTDSETLGNAPITVSGNNATFAGNVTLSDGALTIYESAATSPAISATSGWGGGVSNPIINFGRVGSAVAGSIGYDDPSTCLYIGTTTSHKFKFRTNNVDAITIDTSQNVGIGTTNPLNKTHIVGPTLTTGTETSYGLAVSDIGDESKTLILGYDLVNDVGIIQAIDQQTAWKNLAFGISGNSKVGIGTVSPISKLEISGPTGSYSSGIGFSATGTGARTYRTYIGTNGYFYFDDATGGSSRLTIDTSGNVGIGTTSPSGKLNVNVENAISTVTISRGGSDLTAGTALGNIVFPADYSGTPTTYASIDAYANALSGVRGSLDFNVKSTGGSLLTGMTVYGTSSGANVGIGTTTPSSKLQVAGGIQMADDTDNAGAAKAGTMRYRTGTEYVEVTGTELITNGDFASSSNWSVTGGWTISGGKANYVSGATSYLVQTGITLTSGVVYRVRFNVSGSSGNGAYIWIGNQAGSVNYLGATYKYYADGDFEEIFTMPSNQTAITFYSQVASSNFSMDNVTLMEVTSEDASYADMCMQTGASTYEWINIVRNTY